MSDTRTATSFALQIDRKVATPIGEQIYANLRRAIMEGVLKPGARLPSGRDLATQLGVARGTVRSAYDRLTDEQLVFGAGSSGTHVCMQFPETSMASDVPLDRTLAGFTRPYSSSPLPFQMGVPAHDAYPAKTWARMRTRSVRSAALGYATYADPRGEPELRAEIASHLAISRQIRCRADQIIVTSGYRQGLTLSLTALQAHGRKAWMEEPGYPIGRRALEIAGVVVQPVSVDGDGLRVEEGRALAPDALLAIVTPGQHAPFGATMSPSRREALISWARDSDSWVIEDDYLGELQLEGRAAPALASGEGADRVIHLGTFSKTISPALGLGFVVAPLAIAEQMVEIAAVAAPAPNRTTQLAVGQFLADGHFLRHMREMKALYAQRRLAAFDRLNMIEWHVRPTGLGLVVELPQSVDDLGVVRDAREHGLAPAPLSPWFARPEAAGRGLVLSATNLRPDNLGHACETLRQVVAKHAQATDR